MTYFKLLLLTPHFEKTGVRYYTEDTISEFYNQEDSYNSKQNPFLSATNYERQDNITLSNSNESFLNQDDNYVVAESNINDRKNTFCYTYNEKLSKSLNGQKSLTFSLDRYLMIENEWKENPFARLFSIGTQLLLIDGFGNEYIFTIKNIKYSFKEINTTYDITCDDSFTYQTIRQNSGYTLENNASSVDFIGALNIDEWTQQYIIKDCHIFYNYLPLEIGLYESKNKEIFTFRYGDDLYNVQRILKEPYRPSLKDANGKVLEERDGIYFETFPFSCSGSNANAALIALGESLGLQLKTFEHARYQGSNRQNIFDCYFWFEPQKNDKRLGLTYSPRDSIQSFGLTHAGDSLTTVLNVEGPEYDEELITLLPTPPGIFLDLFNSEEWKNSGYAPGYFSSYCSGREYSTIIGNLDIVEIPADPERPEDPQPEEQCFKINNFTLPQFFNKIAFRTEEDQTDFSILSSGATTIDNITAITDRLYLEIESFDIDNNEESETYGQRINEVVYDIYENEEIPTFIKRENTNYYIKWDGTQGNINENFTVILYFYRDVTVEEQEFAEMADKCPWLENKIIDFSYFLDNNIISKDEYNSLMNILQNELRIVNGQLMFYAQAYYTALHERTKILAELTNNLDLLGAECEASIIEPLTERGAVDILYSDDFKNIYNNIMSSVVNPKEKIAILDYDDIVTDYLNKYINSDQRFLKNLYNFSNYFYTTNSFSAKNLYPYTLTINSDFNPSSENLIWTDDKATSVVNWYTFNKTNYSLITSNFKYYVGYKEENEDETVSNYGRPLVTLFKKNLQDGYLYNVSNEIVYNNPDSYSPLYILDEEKKESFLYIDTNENKYDDDIDYFLVRLKVRIYGLGIQERIWSPDSNPLNPNYIFNNHFDIDNNKDYTTYINAEDLYITINKTTEGQTISKYYEPIGEVKFIEWKKEQEGNNINYYAYSEPIRVKEINNIKEINCNFEFYKTSLSELNKTYLDFLLYLKEETTSDEQVPDDLRFDNYFIKEKTYYEPVSTIYDSETHLLSDIEYRQAYETMRSFAAQKLLYRCTEWDNKWDSNSEWGAATNICNTTGQGDYLIYLKYLPLDNIYVKTNNLQIDNKTYEYKILNKEGKNEKDFKEGWNSFLQDNLQTLDTRTGNPYGYKTYKPLSFVNWQNKGSFFRHVMPNLWKPVVTSCVATLFILPASLGAAAATVASLWIWYYNAYSPGTEGRSNHDFFGDNHNVLDIDDVNSTWILWHTIDGDKKPYYIFFKTAESYLEYKDATNKIGQPIFTYNMKLREDQQRIEEETAHAELDNNIRALAGWWTAQNNQEEYKLVPWAYDLYWNKLGLTTAIIEGWLRVEDDKNLIGDLYIQNPHFLRPVKSDDRIYKGKTYKVFIISDGSVPSSKYSAFNTFLSNNNKINSIWYYPIYKSLKPIDLSQIDIANNGTTFSALGYDKIDNEREYLYQKTEYGKTLVMAIFEEIDYNLKPVSEIEYTGAEKYYDSNGREKIPFKENDFTEKVFRAPTFEECLIHPESFDKDVTYYIDPKGEKRAYTLYQIKNSSSTKWQFGYLDANSYEWDAFDADTPKYSTPIIKNEIQLLWTREGGTPKYVIKSINSNFLPIYQDLEFTDWNNHQSTITTVIGDDTVELTCSYGDPESLSDLTNGDFWYKYHGDLNHPLLQQYAAAVECKLTEYWSSAFTNSKYCNYFIPETWTSVGKLTNNYFADRIVMKNPDRDKVSLNIEYIPNIKIYTDKQKTVLKKYYYKYHSSTLAPEDLINTEDQEAIQRILRKNISIKAIFDDLEDISLDNVICTEQGNTSYYYIENGGKTWKTLIREATSLSLDYFSGLYKMSLIKILKSYKPLPMTEYYRLKKAHDSIWSSKLFQRFGFLILENNYKDTLSTTSKELYQAAVNAFRDYSNPERQYNLTLIDVASLKGYHGQDLRIGDAIRIDAQEYYNEYDQIYNSLSQYLFITDINYNLRNATDISVTVNAIKYQDKLIQKLVKLIK